MKGSYKDVTSYLNHPLNCSKTKRSHSFIKSDRFQQIKSHSPNKYYDIPTTFNLRSSVMGARNRTNIKKMDVIDRGAYHIVSSLDKKEHSKGYSFGISRQQYYKPKQTKSFIGPGAYNINTNNEKQQHFYIGRKISQTNHNHNASCTSYINSGQCLNLLSNFKNSKKTYRIKTDYFEKKQFYEYDNKVPGPGAYSDLIDSFNRANKHNNSTFDREERLKFVKKNKIVGPGKYQHFSEFGYSLF